MAEGLEAEPEMLLQPETRPISHEQLEIEVEGINAELAMVEYMWIAIYERFAAAQRKYQSLIALHKKQLLHEHNDFFLASRSASNYTIFSDFTTLSNQYYDQYISKYISKHKEQSSIPSSGSNAGSIQDSDNQRESTFKPISQDECSAKRWLISAVSSYLCPRMYQLSARILLSFSLIVPTTARTIPKTTESAEIASSITVAASSLTGLSYVAFLAAVLSVAFYMAALRDPISVWGCMMSIWAFGWWAIKDDAHTTLWDCGT